MIKDAKGRFPGNDLWGDGWGWALFLAKEPGATWQPTIRLTAGRATSRPRRTTGCTSADTLPSRGDGRNPYPRRLEGREARGENGRAAMSSAMATSTTPSTVEKRRTLRGPYSGHNKPARGRPPTRELIAHFSWAVFCIKVVIVHSWTRLKARSVRFPAWLRYRLRVPGGGKARVRYQRVCCRHSSACRCTSTNHRHLAISDPGRVRHGIGQQRSRSPNPGRPRIYENFLALRSKRASAVTGCGTLEVFCHSTVSPCERRPEPV